MRRVQRNPRRADPRILHLKIRVTLTEPMTKADARARLDTAMRTRRVPRGIRIDGIDWAKGEGARANAGEVMPEEVYQALRDFYGAITHEGTRTRFEEVSE